MTRIACQSITFGGDMHKNHMDEVMKAVASCGYKGIEIGFRRLDCDKPDYYKDLLKQQDLELVAIHVGGDFTDLDSVNKQMDGIRSVIKLAHELECHNIFISGKKGLTRDEYLAETVTYNRIGGMIRSEGLVLSYHNHYWEFENEAYGFKTIIEQTEPDNLSFVPDVGWIRQAGYDPLPVLEQIKGRISNVHFKEFDKEGTIVELGKGVVDFPEIYRFISGLKDMWIIAEQDRTSISATVSICENYRYILNLADRI